MVLRTTTPVMSQSLALVLTTGREAAYAAMTGSIFSRTSASLEWAAS